MRLPDRSLGGAPATLSVHTFCLHTGHAGDDIGWDDPCFWIVAGSVLSPWLLLQPRRGAKQKHTAEIDI